MMRDQIKRVSEAFPDAAVDHLDPQEMAVDAFRADLMHGPDSQWWWYGPHVYMIRIAGSVSELRGLDLACWCPLNFPCHGDVLLEVASG
jgi:hypothetical protein